LLSLFNPYLILHLKVLINFFFFLFIIIIIIAIIVVVILLLLTIIYTINLPVVRSRSCRVIYYFDTPALGRRLVALPLSTLSSMPVILMREVFTGINFKGFILICVITSLERILVALPLSTNILWTW